MTHSLRPDLWKTIPFRVLLGHFGIPIGSLTIKPALARHTGVRRVFGSRQSDHIQPHRCTWVVIWLFCFRSTPQRSLIYGPLSRVLFGESLVNRLYSEIDQIHLSIEVQCVSHYYPRWTATIYICRTMELCIYDTCSVYNCMYIYHYRTMGMWNCVHVYRIHVVHVYICNFQCVEYTDASGLQEAWLGDWWYQLWGTKWAATGNQLGSC